MEHKTDFRHELGLRRENMAENCVEYYLFILDQDLDRARHIQSLDAAREAADQLCQSLTESYVWHKDEFSIELKTSHGLIFLHGSTNYGDAIEDEWLIVYMLRELTKLFPSLWARVADTDGEFLLIEAANTLPNWINPEMDENRVWLHNSKLYIIPPQVRGEDDIKGSSRKIDLRDAVDFLRHTPNALFHSHSVETEAFYRIKKYPDFVKSSTHYSLVTIPRKLAYVLQKLPRSISMAVEMFYLRDAITMQPIISNSCPLVFPPNDLVTTSVRFSKVLFAQLMSQRFEHPPQWRHLFPKISHSNVSSSEKTHLSALETGMKITIGYEMLARVANKSNRVVGELQTILQELGEDGTDSLPTNEDMEAWPNHGRNDDDRWLEIDFSDLERELEGRHSRQFGEHQSGVGNSHCQVDLRKIVSRFEAFLSDENAGIDGVNFNSLGEDDDDDDGDGITDMSEECHMSEEETVMMDEETFAQIMRDITGLRHHKSEITMNDKAQGLNGKTLSRLDENKIESDEVQHLANQFQAELEQHRALDLHPDLNAQYKRLNQSENGLSQSKTSSQHNVDNETVDIDYNLAKNILESFKSQGGMAGPTSNILGMMGLTLPRDEEG